MSKSCFWVDQNGTHYLGPEGSQVHIGRSPGFRGGKVPPLLLDRQAFLSGLKMMAGYRIHENWALRWDQIFVLEEQRVIVCGEAGHVVHTLFRAAWRVAARRDLEVTLSAFASRVGVE